VREIYTRRNEQVGPSLSIVIGKDGTIGQGTGAPAWVGSATVLLTSGPVRSPHEPRLAAHTRVAPTAGLEFGGRGWPRTRINVSRSWECVEPLP
jgi:hypothetical protein